MGHCEDVQMSTNEQFTVTEQWLKRNSTANGGYTKGQLQLVGVDWPPSKGWQRALIDAKIPVEDARRFEQMAASTFNRGRK